MTASPSEMVQNPLHTIFNPRSVAFVGASNNVSTMGTIQMVNCLSGGFSGPVIPIHPKDDMVLGRKAYRRLTDLPEPVDLAVLVVPTRVALDVVQDAIARGIRHLVITTAGFREGGPEGKEREEKLAKLAKESGLRFVGPNCIGVLNTFIGLNTTFFPHRHASGPLSLASQSGTYVTQTLDLLDRWGIGLCKAISIGNSVNIDLADCLDYFATDPQTKAVALYIEGIRDGQRFIQAAKKCSAAKPVVALYVGGTEGGARSGMSHTGAMGGSDEIYDGMFRQCGILRAHSVADLYQWGWALATQPLPGGDRMAILTHSGGPATSMADAVSRAGLKLPRFSDALQAQIRQLIPATGAASNPIDMTFFTDYQILHELLPRLLLSDSGLDGLLMHGLQGSTFFEDIAQSAKNTVPFTISTEQFSEMVLQTIEPLCRMPAESKKPIVMSCFYDRRDNVVRTLQDHGIPVFDTPERAVSAMAALVQYANLRRSKTGRGPDGPAAAV